MIKEVHDKKMVTQINSDDARKYPLKLLANVLLYEITAHYYGLLIGFCKWQGRLAKIANKSKPLAAMFDPS